MQESSSTSPATTSFPSTPSVGTSSLHEFRDAKETLTQWLHAVSGMRLASEVASGLSSDTLSVRESLLGLARQVQLDTFKVAVLGEYSSGKSSLLNVLLRLLDADAKKTDGLLPTAITPTTAVITTLLYDETRTIRLSLDDGRELEVNAEQLNGFLTEASLRTRRYPWSSNAEENEEIAKHITQVRIGCVSPLLGEGVELVDTPGLGSINEDHARITRQYTAEIDAALFLVSVDPPMGEREMTFLQHIKTVTDRCLFVQTKRDLGERSEHGELVWKRREREHRRRIGEVLGHTQYPFFCVSAYQAARGLRRQSQDEFRESGFEALESELQHFLVAERGVPRFERWLKRARYGLTLLQSSIDTERRQLEARFADVTIPPTTADEYALWKAIQRKMDDDLVKNASEAEWALEDKHDQFMKAVSSDAQREMSIISGEQLADNPDRRFQIERAVTRSVQYHSSDLLPPIVDHHVVEAQKALSQALGDDLPKSFQQFQNADFDWTTSGTSVDLSSVVTKETRIKEEMRGGLGFIDLLFGPKKIEVTEHLIDSTRFMAAVEKATEETFREVKSGLRSTLAKLRKAVNAETNRIVKASRDAADQHARIQKQDIAECETQLARNRQESSRLAEYREDVEQIAMSIHDLAA